MVVVDWIESIMMIHIYRLKITYWANEELSDHINSNWKRSVRVGLILWLSFSYEQLAPHSLFGSWRIFSNGELPNSCPCYRSSP
mmetsp:Transcript_1988/g.3035  ORF Transcript_1988/g.3035 Transcript_1988/m.3035 type:complete len:84 (-) Transcript_1988:3340-3591(-)